MNHLNISEIIFTMEPKFCEQFQRECLYSDMSLNKYTAEIAEPHSNRYKIFAKWTQQIGVCAECLRQIEDSDQK